MLNYLFPVPEDGIESIEDLKSNCIVKLSLIKYNIIYSKVICSDWKNSSSIKSINLILVQSDT